MADICNESPLNIRVGSFRHDWEFIIETCKSNVIDSKM